MSAEPTEWILVRGLGREAEHWGEFPDILARTFPKASVRCLDLPGAGVHWRERSPSRIPDFVERLRGSLGTSKGRMAIGLSLGAMILVDWMYRHAEDFSGVVLINSSLKGVSPIYRRMTLGAMRGMLTTGLTRDPFGYESSILRMTSSREFDRDFLSRRAELRRNRPVSLGNALRQLVAAATYTPSREKPPVPVLLLNSLGDRLAHPDCSRDLRDRWNAELRTHATAGHDLPLDDPRWLADQVHQWCHLVLRPDEADR